MEGFSFQTHAQCQADSYPIAIFPTAQIPNVGPGVGPQFLSLQGAAEPLASRLSPLSPTRIMQRGAEGQEHSVLQQRGHQRSAYFPCHTYTCVSCKICTSSLVFPPWSLSHGSHTVLGQSPPWPCPVARSHLIPEGLQLDSAPSVP